MVLALALAVAGVIGCDRAPAAPSRDEVVKRYLDALSRHDAAAMAALTKRADLGGPIQERLDRLGDAKLDGEPRLAWKQEFSDSYRVDISSDTTTPGGTNGTYADVITVSNDDGNWIVGFGSLGPPPTAPCTTGATGCTTVTK